jgi:hypothetical protein
LWFRPGHGKTATALIYDKWVRHFLREQNDPRADWPTLVWTTASAKWQWAVDEIREWRLDLLTVGKVCVIDGDPISRDAQIELMVITQPEIVIIHHAQIGTAVEGVFDFLRDTNWLGVYSDEDQHFKNWSSQRTQRKNAIQREFLVSVTGTPESGYPDKLHAIVHGIAPGPYKPINNDSCLPGINCPLPAHSRKAYQTGCRGCFNYLHETNSCKVMAHVPTESDLGIREHYKQTGEFRSLAHFKQKFCLLEEGRVVGSYNEEHLHDQIYGSGYAYRYSEAEVYPDRTEPVVHKIALPMSPEQEEMNRIVCLGLRAFFDENMEEALSRGSSFILALLTHVRRVTTLSPGAFMSGYKNYHPVKAAMQFPQVLAKGTSTKVEWALDFIRDNVLDTNNKIIIGSEWDDCVQELEARLERMGLVKARPAIQANDLEWNVTLPKGNETYYACITGSVSNTKHRQALKQAFNTDPRLKVMLMTQAGYEALNLTGGVQKGQTMYVICLGVPWLPAPLQQLFKRADRLNMQGDISIFLPACVGTIDEQVHSILYGKALSADRIVDGNFSDDTVAARLSLRDAKSIAELLSVKG